MTEKVFDCVATAASGLEALVGKELRDLGIECQVENGRARFKGTLRPLQPPISGYAQLTALRLWWENLMYTPLMNYLSKSKHYLGKTFCR